MAEQARIEAQLHELEGMRDIQVGLELTHINEDDQMSVDKAPEPRPIEAKLRALEKFVRVEAFKFHTLPPLPFFIIVVVVIFLALALVRLSRFVVPLFIKVTYLFYREALSVNRMATRCRDCHLKKL